MRQTYSNCRHPYRYYCFYEEKLCMRKLILLLFYSRETPLHWSAKGDSGPIGETARRANEKGCLEVCRLLLQCNADVEAKATL